MMPSRKIYSGDYEAKLARVMERLGAESYNYDWTRAACFIEFIYHGQLYRFEHSVEKAKTHGQNIVHVSDLFAQLVMTLEDIARMTERGIYELQSWIEGMKALPAPRAAVPPCFQAMGFTDIPKSEEEIKTQYKRMAKVMHPDAGGSAAAFDALTANYKACLEYLN